jgi:alpha-beta hydrolase superfamily lysophospholipase
MPVVPLESEWFTQAVPSRNVCSQWFVRETTRPLLVLVGGWQPIRAISAEHLWPIKRLDCAGFDVAIAQMPALPVSSAGAAKVTFPSGDPSRNVIELARFACSIQQVLLVAKCLGHERVVIWGTSLGAYLVALLATVEQPLMADGYVLEKPLLQMSDPMRLHGRGPASIRRDVALRLDRVYRAVSPIQRKPRIDPDRVHVIGALYDGVTPASGAEQLANHFGATYHSVQASHIYDPGRFKRTVEMVRSLASAVASTSG